MTQDALTAYFNAEWYAWQNPDWTPAHEKPFDHYMAVGRFENRDPSPMIDMKRYGDVVGDAIAPEDRLEAIAKGRRRPALGVYESWRDLDDAQERFIRPIKVVRGRDSRRARRRNLVFLQAGPQSRHWDWFEPDTPRSWDLVVNYYDARGFDAELGDAVYFQPGTKFTAIANLLKIDRSLLAYDYVLLLDDDILTSMDAVEGLFAACQQHELDLAQMSLSDNSSCIWESLYARGRRGLRRLNAVEIMMPALSRRALTVCALDFSRSVSGFGLDLLMAKRMAAPDCANIAVLDEFVAEHVKPVDDASGAYYSFLRSRLINPKAELWRLVEQFDLDRDIREVAATAT
jgi:hypothetical protein